LASIDILVNNVAQGPVPSRISTKRPKPGIDVNLKSAVLNGSPAAQIQRGGRRQHFFHCRHPPTAGFCLWAVEA
jgi:hypothetical protein